VIVGQICPVIYITYALSGDGHLYPLDTNYNRFLNLTQIGYLILRDSIPNGTILNYSDRPHLSYRA